jgi:hypothetical protein
MSQAVTPDFVFDVRLLKLVPVERIELPTFGLQNRCSTAELYRPRCSLRATSDRQGRQVFVEEMGDASQ